MPMQYLPIDSKVAFRVGYDPDTNVLEVHFKTSGQTWQYDNVPESIWTGATNGTSFGKLFHSAIKGKFAARRVA